VHRVASQEGALALLRTCVGWVFRELSVCATIWANGVLRFLKRRNSQELGLDVKANLSQAGQSAGIQS